MIIKRDFLTLLLLSIMLFAYAGNKDLEKDITMVSYEQGTYSHRAKLTLKNNTNEEINHILFQIIYLDMDGNPIDYKDFSQYIDIAPGMVKKLEIPAYGDFSDNYCYFESQDNFSDDSRIFKIQFQLKDYNNSPSSSIDKIVGSYFLFVIIATLLVLVVSICLYVLVAVMAKKRNRSVVLWVLLSILATPLLMIIILLCIGKDNEHS